MAYKTSEKYKNIIYGEDYADNNILYFEYGDTIVEDSSPYVSSLQITRRLLDNGSMAFKLDNFVGQQITLEMHDYPIQDLTKEFYFKLGTKVDDDYEFVPIGYFKIKDNPETANGKVTYKLVDRAEKFDFNYDASPLIEQNGGSATLLQILQDICKKANVELATADFIGKDKKIGIYDNTIKARIYVTYIAELSCSIATIGRDGKLYLIPIKKENNNAIEIEERILNQSMTTGDKYKISKVIYENGATIWSAGDDTADTLFINSANPFISSQEDINLIYNQIKDFEIYSVNTGSIIGNPAIDPWDFIKFNYTDDENKVTSEFITLGQYDFVFNGVYSQTFDTQIDRLAKSQNTSLNSSNTRFSRLRQEIDTLNGSLKIVSEKQNEIEQDIQTTKEASGNPIEVDDAGAYQLVSMEIDGKSYQETRSDKNKFAITQGGSGYGITATYNEDGTFNFKGTASSSASTGGSTLLSHYFTFDEMGVENGKTYTISSNKTIPKGLGVRCEVYNESDSGAYTWVRVVIGQMDNARPVRYGTLNTEGGNRIRLSFQVFKDAVIDIENIGFQIEEGSVATDWQPYGVIPSTKNPSEIKSVKGITNLFDYSKWEKNVPALNASNSSIEVKDNSITISSTTTTDTFTLSGMSTTGGVVAENQRKYLIPVKPNRKYALIFDVSSSGNFYQNNDQSCYYSLYTKDFKSTRYGNLTNMLIPSRHIFRFTTDSDTEYVGLRLGVRNANNTITYKNIMLVEDNLLYTYVPYGTWLPQITTGKNLCNIQEKPYYNGTGLTVVNSGPGVYLMSGTGTATKDNELRFLATWNTKTVHWKLPKGNYKMYAWLDDVAIKTEVTIADNNTNKYGGSSFSLNDLQGIATFRLLIPIVEGKVYNNSIIKIMIVEESNDDGNYEEYKENISLLDMNKPNLFDGVLQQGTIVGDGSDSPKDQTRICSKNYISIDPNTHYTITFDSLGNFNYQVYVFLYNSDDFKTAPVGNTNWLSINNNNSIIFNTPSNVKYARFIIRHDDSSYIIPSEIGNVYFYQGSKPYYEFSEIKEGNNTKAKDSFKNGIVAEQVYKIVLNGHEDYSVITNTVGLHRVTYYLPKMGKASSFGICSHFTSKAREDGEWNYYDNCYIGNEGNNLIMYSEKADTLEHWKEYVKQQFDNGTPITFCYRLDTPQTYTLPYTPLTLFEGYNRITVDDELNPNLKIKYLVNSKINADFVSRSEFNISNEGIKLEVGEKVSNDEFNSAISDLNSKLTLEAGEIRAEVSKTINDINIGGTNLLKGTATASGDVGNGYGTVAVVDTDLYGGLKGVKTHTAWTGQYMNLKAVASRGGFEVGDNLVASVYIKADRDVVATVTFHRSYGTGNIMGSTKSYRDVTLTPKWQQFWFPFTADDGSLNRTDTRVEINVATGDNYIYWAGWKLEKGTKATDWSPSPDDYSTTTQMNNIIQQKIDDETNEIKLEVNKKVNNSDFTKAQIVAKINDNTSTVKIAANNINLNGAVTANNYFKINTDGSMEATNGKFTGNILIKDAGETGGYSNLKIESNNGTSTFYSNGFNIKSGQNTLALNTNRISLSGSNALYPNKSNLRFYAEPGNMIISDGSVSNIDNIIFSCNPDQINIRNPLIRTPPTLPDHAIRLQDLDSRLPNISKILPARPDDPYLEVTIPNYGALGFSTGAYGISMWPSDKRLKQDIEDSQVNALEIVKNIKHREFRYKNSPDTLIKIGYVADELQELDEQMIFEVGEDKIKQPKESYIIPILSKAIQEQQEIIEKQQRQIDDLEKRLSDLEKIK